MQIATDLTVDPSTYASSVNQRYYTCDFTQPKWGVVSTTVQDYLVTWVQPEEDEPDMTRGVPTLPPPFTVTMTRGPVPDV